VKPRVLGWRNALEVLERIVERIPVNMVDVMPRRNWAVRLSPDGAMQVLLFSPHAVDEVHAVLPVF
jgi:hypothetical protein